MDCSMPGFPVLHHFRELTYSCPSSWWCPPTIPSSVAPFSSCSQSFPASGSFPMSRCFPSGGQSISPLQFLLFCCSRRHFSRGTCKPSGGGRGGLRSRPVSVLANNPHFKHVSQVILMPSLIWEPPPRKVFLFEPRVLLLSRRQENLTGPASYSPGSPHLPATQ